MQYRTIGKTDIQVSSVALGTWAIGGRNWGAVNDQDSIAAIHKALDEGITLIDTAPVYGHGHAEEVVGKALKGRRRKAVIATKCGLLIDQANKRSLAPADIRTEFEASCRRMKTDTIDVYFCHWPDTQGTPIEETVGELTKMRQEGKIRCFGLSNHGPDLVKRALAAGPLACLQEHYSLVKRDVEKELLPLCGEFSLGLFAYGPLGGGILTGKYTEKPDFSGKDVRQFFYPFYKEPLWSRTQALLAVIKQAAEARKVSPAEVAIAWIMKRPQVSCALVGARNPAQVAANAPAAELSLTDGEMERLTAASDAIVG